MTRVFFCFTISLPCNALYLQQDLMNKIGKCINNINETIQNIPKQGLKYPYHGRRFGVVIIITVSAVCFYAVLIVLIFSCLINVFLCVLTSYFLRFKQKHDR